MGNQIQTQEFMDIITAVATMAIVALGFQAANKLLLPGNPGHHTKALKKPKTLYRLVYKHIDPIIAAAQKRSGEHLEGHLYAYSREQAKLMGNKRFPGYRVSEVYEETRPQIPLGTCYPDAARYVIKHEEGTLVHGTTISLGNRMGHAWVELPGGFIWEPYSGETIARERFQELSDPIEHAKYSSEEVAVLTLKTRHFGPWTEKERTGNPGATVFTSSEIYPNYTLYVSTVRDESGKDVLESTFREYNDRIELLTRYAKPGEAMKGYGTAAFVDPSGPLALSLNTGKPMVVDELSHDAAAFYNALEHRGIARFRQTPNAPHAYVIEPLEGARRAISEKTRR